MKKRLILVAGNIGAGKTSITEKLGERLGWKTGFESVADNPYLPDFYASMADWSFHLQVFFLGHRAEQHIVASESDGSAILDRSIFEDFYIFARALRQLGNMNERDYNAYRAVFNLVIKSLPKPDLLIYLSAPVEVLKNRINQRGREIETGISEDYLKLLESFYQEWLRNFDICPVLTIKSNDLNFVDNSEDLDIVVERINKTLAGRDELILGD
ncbi:MAG: deoxynucleoside kinase [Chloroflexi bacterium]|jgi:deoxyadenosine/deoxycytidine kinase|nr:deoxynucleoside kinase [Chloroflexota bacterium]MBT3671023.1 deoxynucleoside kinase [Chloroflexota bacterium]MBT4003582.1 deoxynucleoside kinase [Chloroflexota bacterium]MBT4305056.1 deoxynucleoside kinase [Chloroflexota bacterium]MBT4533867.1 deoxynucleoside kinase [Chloroflexota bacterium]